MPGARRRRRCRCDRGLLGDGLHNRRLWPFVPVAMKVKAQDRAALVGPAVAWQVPPQPIEGLPPVQKAGDADSVQLEALVAEKPSAKVPRWKAA